MTAFSSILLILLILTWAYIFLIKSHPEKKIVTKADLINQNFEFIKKTEERGEWVDFKKAKLTVYNPNEDENRIMTGKNESYFYGKKN